jgi:hypothetical protein
MFRCVTCPDAFADPGRSLFLGGGISGCPDWQREMIYLLDGIDLTILNPRRASFDMSDSSMHVQQIGWEYAHLRIASAILFWFPCETLCPITLYELGAWSMTDKALFIGTHPRYARKDDIIVQTCFVRPDIQVVHSLDALAQRVMDSVLS